jgi:ATP-dependent DNA helicase RecQ
VALDVLRSTFGHAQFRGLQAGVISEVLAGHNALAVLPTGGGKSLCYQIPSLVRPGLGLVISPLIALMADQVAALQQLGIAAERLDASTSPASRAVSWQRIKDATLDLLYVSPEGLMQPSILERFTNLPLALVAIDEAHCVSNGATTFRPEYRMLGRLCRALSRCATSRRHRHRRLPALATISAPSLHLKDAREFVDSFARPELALSAERKQAQGHDRVLKLVADRPRRSGVIYVGSRDGVDKLAEKLIAARVPALAYHAGLDNQLRTARLEQFLAADAAVMVATIALRHGRRQARRALCDPRGSTRIDRVLLAGDRTRRPRWRTRRRHHPLFRLRSRLGSAPYRRPRRRR